MPKTILKSSDQKKRPTVICNTNSMKQGKQKKNSHTDGLRRNADVVDINVGDVFTFKPINNEILQQRCWTVAAFKILDSRRKKSPLLTHMTVVYKDGLYMRLSSCEKDGTVHDVCMGSSGIFGGGFGPVSNEKAQEGFHNTWIKECQPVQVNATKSHTDGLPFVQPEFAQLLEAKLKDLPDVSRTLCVSVLQKGRAATPEDADNHIEFLVSQDPNFDHQDIGCCPHGKTPVMVDWEKPWYLIYIYDWTWNGGDYNVEQYPKRYCPLHMDAELLKQFYAEFDCGIGVTDIKERFHLDNYEWTSIPRGFDAACQLLRVK